MTKQRRTAAALFLATALLFLIANRGAYKGFFDGDDIDNIAWTRDVPLRSFLWGFLSPQFYRQNFRPAGHFFYAVMGRTAGFDYGWYVAALQLLHLVNVLLLWLLLRRLGFRAFASGAAVLFFAFHMAVFDAYWKPMYIFDVLCAFFCLLSLLSYTWRKWALSFVFFWLAYKSKEMAVLLPAVLALYEWWFGEKQWKRLLPFLVAGLLFGVQGVLLNPHTDDAYTIRFGPQALWTTISFYSSLLFLIPYAGLAVLVLPWLVRDRRLNFGLAWLALLLVPVLLLPGRLFGAYLYVPLAGAAICFAAVVAKGRTWRAAALTVAFFAIWIPFNYARLRDNRRALLTVLDENHTYFRTLEQAARKFPAAQAFVYDGVPSSLHGWGVNGALRYLYNRTEPELYPADGQDCAKAFRSGSFAVLHWDPVFRKLIVLTRKPDTPDVAYFRIAQNREQPIWQLGEGWFPWEWSFRWIKPYATARLHRPAGARTFEMVAHLGPDQMRAISLLTVEVFLNGTPAGRREFTHHGIQTVRWNLPPAPPGPVTVEFRVSPEFRPDRDSRPLGLPIEAFGFPEDHS